MFQDPGHQDCLWWSEGARVRGKGQGLSPITVAILCFCQVYKIDCRRFLLLTCRTRTTLRGLSESSSLSAKKFRWGVVNKFEHFSKMMIYFLSLVTRDPTDLHVRLINVIGCFLFSKILNHWAMYLLGQELLDQLPRNGVDHWQAEVHGEEVANTDRGQLWRQDHWWIHS